MKLVLIVVLCFVGATAAADPRAWQPDAVFSQLSAGEATDAWSIGSQWRWRRAWSVRDLLVLRGRWEISVGRWRADTEDGGSDRAWITQVSLVPTLRLSSLSDRGWYAEAGSGPSFLMPVFHSRDRVFSRSSTSRAISRSATCAASTTSVCGSSTSRTQGSANRIPG